MSARLRSGSPFVGVHVDLLANAVQLGQQPLMPLGGMSINMSHVPGAGGFLPEGLGQSPLEDLGTDRRGPSAVNSGDDILQPAQIFFAITRRRRLSRGSGST